MVIGPTNLNPLFLRSWLILFDSLVSEGISLVYLNEFLIGRFLTKDHM